MEKHQEKVKQVNSILNEWDFIGVFPGEGGPTDEYNCMVGPLVTLLEKKAGRDEIRTYLDQELTEHFGIEQYSNADFEKALDKLVALQ